MGYQQGSHPLHERQCNVPPKDPRDQVFGQILRAAGIRDVFYEPIRILGERHTSLGNLQRMIPHHLQGELVEDISQIKTARPVDRTQAGKIESAWSSNPSSIRDWDLMVTYSAKAKCDPFRDPFVSTSAHLLKKKLMSDAGIVQLSSKEMKDVDTEISNDYAVLPPIIARQ